MFRAGLIALLLLALLATASCGGGTADARGAAFVPTASLDTVNSIGADNAQVSLLPSDKGDSYDVKVSGLTGAKAIYGEVDYDPSTVHVDGALAADGSPALNDGTLTDKGQLVMVVDEPQNSRLVFGLVLADWQNRAGLDGSLTLAHVSFASGPASAVRGVSTPPGPQPYDAIDLQATKDGNGKAVLTWLENLGGDGNNDGIVNISDMTALGASINKPITNSVGKDADYDKNGQVAINDLSALGAQFGATLGGYKVMSAPSPTGPFTEAADIPRTTMFPTKPLPGEVTWTWTSPAPLTADTSYKVVPYDSTPAKATGHESDVETLTGTVVVTVTAIDQITYDDPNSVVLMDGTTPQVILTEESVDSTPGNAPAFSLESLQLHALGETDQDPGQVDVTDQVLWYIVDGAELADVDNTAGQQGLLTFHNRGKITVRAQKIGDFNMTADLTIELLSIESVDLTGPSASPLQVSAGTPVQFHATGTFDNDGVTNGNEQTIDITPYANWGYLEDTGSTNKFSIGQSAGVESLDTSAASSGNGVRVFAEYPGGGGPILLGDNQLRASPYYRVNIN